MAAYIFKLQKLLDFRVKTEDEKKNQLSLAIKRLEQEKDKLSELKAAQREMDRVFNEKTSCGIGANELKLLANYIDYYKRGVKSQKTMVKMADDYVSLCREELVKATQEKKMIEKLREIDLKKYLYEEQKKEEKLIDDLVSFKGNNNA